MNVRVKVLFFGAAREIIGASEREFDFAAEIPAATAFAQILQTFPALGEKFGKSLLFAVNQTYADQDQTIRDGDELAVFPPVSGG